MTPQLRRACRQAVHVITAEGQTMRAGRAGLFVLEAIGVPRLLVWPFTRPPLVWLAEWGYRLVADHRSFFGRFLFTKEG